MPKQFYCAQCGVRLETALKPIPQQGVVLTVVKPHSCEETREEDRFKLAEVELVGKAIRKTREVISAVEDIGSKTKLDTLFDSFNFVQKLNKATRIKPMSSGSGDRRSEASQRKELATSSAPLSVLSRAQSEAGVTSPARDDMEEFEDAD